MTHRFLAALCWLVAALFGLSILLRLLHLDDSAVVIGLIALSPWDFAPIFAVGLFGVWTKRRVLVLAAALVLSLPLWWSFQAFDPFAHGTRPSPGWPRIRIFDANVTWTTTDMANLAAEIVKDHPDVVALEEVTPGDVARLKVVPQLSYLHYQIVRLGAESVGMGLWSDRPLIDPSEWMDAGHPELRASVRVGGVTVSLLVVHTFIPFGLSVPRWKQELAGIAEAAGRLRGARIVLGDFNATSDMYEFDAILRTGLSDLATDDGRGWEMTWSPWHWLPAVARIDHILISPEVAVTGYQVGSDFGGQHHPLLATVAVRP
jgi:endonuclease/exonuclease/phosphatase (EEP) superfamily protein YafD